MLFQKRDKLALEIPLFMMLHLPVEALKRENSTVLSIIYESG
jgi:hypothetical protein